MASAIVTIKEAILGAKEHLNESDSAQLDVETLLAFALKKSRSHLHAWPEKELTKDEQTSFQALVDQRKKGVPIAYITGQREFWSMAFKVNEHTLVPRPETELLVELALERIPANQPCAIADLGTGSGCIAIAIASERPHSHIDAVDACKHALNTARENVKKHGLNNVQLIHGDWCQGLKTSAYDLVISNPPYIEPNDPHLNQGDVRFEPKSALVAENNGLADLHTITKQAHTVLKSGGTILFEHGYNQADNVANMLESAGFQQIEHFQDLQGQTRATSGIKPKSSSCKKN